MVRLPLVDQMIALVRKGPAAPKRAPQRDERLKLVFEQLPLALAIATEDGQWYATNERFRQLIGFTREELARITLHGLTHPDDVRKEGPLIRKLRLGDLESYRVEKRLMSKAGQYRTLDVMVGLIRTSAGEPDCYVLVAEEPAQSNRRHEPLRAAERALASIVDQITDVAIIRTDAKGAINGWNTGATQLFGYTRDEIIGRNRRTLYRDADSWEGNPTRHLHHGAEDGSLTMEDWRVTREGKHLWIKSTLTPLKIDGTVRGYVETVTAPATSPQSIDMAPMLETLRADLDKSRRTEESLREALAHLGMTGEETMNELRIVTVALRKEIDRRKAVEEELRQTSEKLAAAVVPAPEQELVQDAVAPRNWTALGELTPADLLVDLANQKRSGMLVLASEGREREIFFDGGRVFSCASNDPRHFLTQRLVERGWLTEEQRQRAVEVRQQTGLALGRILLILDIITEEQLITAMRRKLEEEIAEVFDWREATYAFIDGAVPSLQLVPLRIDVQPFVAERLLAHSTDAVIGSTKSRKVHRPSCTAVKRISADARQPFATVAEAISGGFDRCRLCFR